MEIKLFDASNRIGQRLSTEDTKFTNSTALLEAMDKSKYWG